MDEDKPIIQTESQSGGVNIAGGNVIVFGDIIGGNQIVQALPPAVRALHSIPPPPHDLIDRTAEIEQLSQGLDRVKSSRGQVTAVVGEPGVGKSRLYYEFTRSHRTRGCAMGETRCLPYAKTTAYQPVIHLLRSYFGIREDDADAVAADDPHADDPVHERQDDDACAHRNRG